MNRLCLFMRYLPSKGTFLGANSKLLQELQFNYSSNSPDDEGASREKKQGNEKQDEALNKLNALLKKMVEEDVVNSKSKLELAKPKGKKRKTDLKEEGGIQSYEKQMFNAVKDVAEALGGDVKQTESELLTKLTTPVEDDKVTNISNLSDIIKGMKIDRETKTPDQQSRAQQVRQILERVSTETSTSTTTRSQRRPRAQHPQTRVREAVHQKINLFGSEPLGIFAVDLNDATEGVENKTWQSLYEKELKLAVTHPPANYFQQLILWTEQGKIWKFPIDNEQGLEEEQNVSFAEHVFLEKHLDSWCPPQGPIRHYMQLVCVGLSKNPYLTLESKKNHIEWYNKYFEEEEKKDLFQKLGLQQIKNKLE